MYPLRTSSGMTQTLPVRGTLIGDITAQTSRAAGLDGG